MNEIKHTPGPVGFVNESALKLMLSGESAQCRLSRMKSGRMAYPLFDGGNMGVRRRQLHTLMKNPAYDPLTASGTV